MRSFAIWHKSNTTDQRELSFHINLWKKEKNNSYLFDLGFLIENLRGIKKIFLYVPFEITKSDIEDLGIKFNSNNLASAVFNDDLTTSTGDDKKVLIQYKDRRKRDKRFYIYHLDIESQISLEKMNRSDGEKGTIITINTTNIIYNRGILRYYFRIRLKIDDNKLKLISNEIKDKSPLNNYLTNTEIIDFRLNDIRSCSQNLRERFHREKRFKITKIHYLILRNASDIIIHNTFSVDSRMLEKDLWIEYIEDIDGDIIAYHMKKKKESENGIESYSNLTRFKYSTSTGKVIGIFILCIILLNLTSNYLFSKISPTPLHTQQTTVSHDVESSSGGQDSVPKTQGATDSN